MNVSDMVSLALSFMVMCSGACAGGEPAARPGPGAEIPNVVQWGPVVGGVQLSARAEKDRYGPCTPIWLTVVSRNASRRLVRITIAGARADLDILVKDQRGRAVGLTAFGKANAGIIISVAPATLRPGQEMRYRILLNRIYDMTRKGQYTIRVKSKALMKSAVDKDAPLPVSNVLKVTIGDQRESR